MDIMTLIIIIALNKYICISNDTTIFVVSKNCIYGRHPNDAPFNLIQFYYATTGLLWRFHKRKPIAHKTNELSIGNARLEGFFVIVNWKLK